MTDSVTASVQDTFMDDLRESTAQAHAATEEIPFNAAILSRTLPRERFAAQVQHWAALHGAVESAISRQDDEAVTRVWALTGPRAGLLHADLVHLGQPFECMDAEAVVQQFTGWVESLSDREPIALLGILYVFEGSQLGGTILKKPLAEMYELTGSDGLSYYNVHGSGIRAHWQGFRDAMNQGVVSESDQASVINAANQAFAYVGRLLECLSRDLSPSAI